MKFTLNIDPGQLRVNSRYMISGGRLVLSSRYRDAVEAARLQVRQACINGGWRTTAKPVRVMVITHWPTQRGDCDSTVKAVCDALQHGKAIANDSQIVELVARKSVDKQHPRLEVEMEELSDA
jgi:Holliday junction resolvase RusA-like endonuclease